MAKYAKIQKNIDGKERYSITPQIPGGYITPENLIKIGEVKIQCFIKGYFSSKDMYR